MKIPFFLILLLLLSHQGLANRCVDIFSGRSHPITNVKDQGPLFLHQRNSKLHTQAFVESRVRRLGVIVNAPKDKLNFWLQSLQKSYEKGQGNERFVARIKNLFFEQYVTRFEEVPQSFYDLQVRIALEQGRGKLVLSESQKLQLAGVAIKDQQQSLGHWVEYLMSPDSSSYPMWTKYWVLTSLVRLGKYNQETGTFGNRSEGQIAAFPELNREALAYVVDSIVKSVNKQSLADIADPAFLQLLAGANFGKLYGRALQLASSQKHDLTVTDGKWVKFERGIPGKTLSSTLEGMNTGWCTAGEMTAHKQLEDGDFYVYYSQDLMGRPRVPRLAIRMTGQHIAEVRGVAAGQHIDTVMAGTKILEMKLNEFGKQADFYRKRHHDMTMLTALTVKQSKNEELSVEELRFLHEIDQPIEGFGNREDPRVEEIVKQRNKRSDFAKIFNVRTEEISFTAEEAIRGGIRYHHGDLDLTYLKSSQGLVLPKSIGGSLRLNGLESADGLKISEDIKGDVTLRQLRSAKGVKFPREMKGSLFLPNLESAEGLVLPEVVGGALNLGRISDPLGLILPKKVGGMIWLSHLRSADGLRFPEWVGDAIFLERLESKKGLVLPANIGNRVHFRGLSD